MGGLARCRARRGCGIVSLDSPTPKTRWSTTTRCSSSRPSPSHVPLRRCRVPADHADVGRVARRRSPEQGISGSITWCGCPLLFHHDVFTTCFSPAFHLRSSTLYRDRGLPNLNRMYALRGWPTSTRTPTTALKPLLTSRFASLVRDRRSLDRRPPAACWPRSPASRQGLRALTPGSGRFFMLDPLAEKDLRYHGLQRSTTIPAEVGEYGRMSCSCSAEIVAPRSPAIPTTWPISVPAMVVVGRPSPGFRRGDPGSSASDAQQVGIHQVDLVDGAVDEGDVEHLLQHAQVDVAELAAGESDAAPQRVVVRLEGSEPVAVRAPRRRAPPAACAGGSPGCSAPGDRGLGRCAPRAPVVPGADGQAIEATRLRGGRYTGPCLLLAGGRRPPPPRRPRSRTIPRRRRSGRPRSTSKYLELSTYLPPLCATPSSMLPPLPPGPPVHQSTDRHRVPVDLDALQPGASDVDAPVGHGAAAHWYRWADAVASAWGARSDHLAGGAACTGEWLGEAFATCARGGGGRRAHPLETLGVHLGSLPPAGARWPGDDRAGHLRRTPRARAGSRGTAVQLADRSVETRRSMCHAAASATSSRLPGADRAARSRGKPIWFGLPAGRLPGAWTLYRNCCWPLAAARYGALALLAAPTRRAPPGGPGSSQLDADDWQLIAQQAAGFAAECNRVGRDPSTVRRSLLLGFGHVAQPPVWTLHSLRGLGRASA